MAGTRRRPNGGVRVVLAALLAFAGGCSGPSAKSRACGRLQVAITDHGALATHVGQPDFDNEVGVYARELEQLAADAAKTHDDALIHGVAAARSSFSQSQELARQGPRVANEELAQEHQFAVAMAEATAGCGHPGRS